MLRRSIPTRGELLEAIDSHEAALAGLIGRWFDAIPAHVRAEILNLRTPLEALLIRAKRRGQPRPRPQPRKRPAPRKARQ